MKNYTAVFFMVLLFFSLGSAGYLASPAQAQFVDNKATNQQISPNQTLEQTTFDKVTTVVNFFFGVTILFSLIALIIAGLKFFVAGGSESALSSANSTWIGAVIGLAVGLVGYVLISILRYYLR